MGRKQMIDSPFRPLRDEIITICRYSTHIKSLTGLKNLNLKSLLIFSKKTDNISAGFFTESSDFNNLDFALIAA